MESILKCLENGEIFVADGAIGSLLLTRGLETGMPPESFNLSQPEVLKEIARSYLQAGAEIIQTNTFGASPLKLANYSLERKTEEINQIAFEVVKRVVGEKAYISASCGPSGKILKPYGDVEPEAIYDNFYRQLKVLITEGVDLVCIETMTDITEAVLAVKAARAVSSHIPIMTTLTFDSTPRGFYTIMGCGIDQAVKQLTQVGVDILGSNCGNGIEKMVLIAREFRKLTQFPLLIQSNAGLPVLKNNLPVYPEKPEFMAEKCKDLIAAGVSIVGGCCGTTPDHIRAIRNVLKPF
jgi:5-methyltetrahydrofolate--homocysteine methyltransferase